MQCSDTFAQKPLPGERGVNVETGFLTASVNLQMFSANQVTAICNPFLKLSYTFKYLVFLSSTLVCVFLPGSSQSQTGTPVGFCLCD